jgi:hypothetical protein
MFLQINIEAYFYAYFFRIVGKCQKRRVWTALLNTCYTLTYSRTLYSYCTYANSRPRYRLQCRGSARRPTISVTNHSYYDMTYYSKRHSQREIELCNGGCRSAGKQIACMCVFWLTTQSCAHIVVTMCMPLDSKCSFPSLYPQRCIECKLQSTENTFRSQVKETESLKSRW